MKVELIDTILDFSKMNNLPFGQQLEQVEIFFKLSTRSGNEKRSKYHKITNAWLEETGIELTFYEDRLIDLRIENPYELFNNDYRREEGGKNFDKVIKDTDIFKWKLGKVLDLLNANRVTYSVVVEDEEEGNYWLRIVIGKYVHINFDLKLNFLTHISLVDHSWMGDTR